jgi:hypothetical protein
MHIDCAIFRMIFMDLFTSYNTCQRGLCYLFILQNAKNISLYRGSPIYNGFFGTLNTLSNACALTEIEPVTTWNGGISNKLTLLHWCLPMLFTTILTKHFFACIWHEIALYNWHFGIIESAKQPNHCGHCLI